jgi:Ca-activated chloride channel family protein
VLFNQKYKVWILLVAQLVYVSGASFYAQADQPQNRNDWRVWLNKARESYRAQDYKNALEYYKNASLGCPEEVNLAPEMAQTYYRLKNNKESKQWYHRAGEDAKIAFNQGNVAFQENQLAEAIEHYKQALKLDPDMENARYNLSKALQIKNKQTPPPPSANQPNPPKQKPKENKDSNPSDSPAENQSGLSDRSIERLLNQLMKQEAQTKRKVSNGKEGGDMKKSTKDW